MHLFKSKILFLCIILSSGFLHAGLIDVYKMGVFTLNASQNFGKNTDWESIFYDEDKHMVVAPDGSIFISNGSQHNLFKFNLDGKLLKTFSQKGQGPGDTNRPSRITILDGRYLVVAEYSLTRRINLFDLNGKHVKVLRTGHSPFLVTALKNGKIIYKYTRYAKGLAEKRKEKTKKECLVLIDAETGIEKEWMTIEIPKKINSNFDGRREASKGSLHIKATSDGNLIVGLSHLPQIRIFSPDGQLIRQFKLNLNPIPLTDEYIKKCNDSLIETLKTRKFGKRLLPRIKKLPEAPRWEYLPLYRDIKVDSEGNILVFKMDYCLENCPKIFQVYSPEGKYICETRLDEGNFDFKISPLNDNISFTKNGIFGLFSLKDSEDVSLRIVKIDIQ
jgi:hypothetical protein